VLTRLLKHLPHGFHPRPTSRRSATVRRGQTEFETTTASQRVVLDEAQSSPSGRNTVEGHQ
jgi:hypothetical protein